MGKLWPMQLDDKIEAQAIKKTHYKGKPQETWSKTMNIPSNRSYIRSWSITIRKLLSSDQ